MQFEGEVEISMDWIVWAFEGREEGVWCWGMFLERV
jgi:hypothetical protein